MFLLKPINYEYLNKVFSRFPKNSFANKRIYFPKENYKNSTIIEYFKNNTENFRFNSLTSTNASHTNISVKYAYEKANKINAYIASEKILKNNGEYQSQQKIFQDCDIIIARLSFDEVEDFILFSIKFDKKIIIFAPHSSLKNKKLAPYFFKKKFRIYKNKAYENILKEEKSKKNKKCIITNIELIDKSAKLNLRTLDSNFKEKRDVYQSLVNHNYSFEIIDCKKPNNLSINCECMQAVSIDALYYIDYLESQGFSFISYLNDAYSLNENKKKIVKIGDRILVDRRAPLWGALSLIRF